MDNSLIVEILQWVGLLIALLIFYWLWKKTSNQWQDTKSKAISGGSGSGKSGQGSNGAGDNERESEAEASRYSRQSERERLANKLKEILKENPELKEFVESQAGKGSANYESWTPDKVEDVAEKLGDEVLDMLDVSTRDFPIDLDLASARSRLVEVKRGGIIRDTVPARDLDDLETLHEEEFRYPFEQIAERILQGKARRVRRFDISKEQDVLYVLRDRSGSMRARMLGGLSRDTWARGVALKFAQLVKARKLRFYFRDFDEASKPLQRVLSHNDVPGFIEYLMNHPAPDNAGTNIFNALNRAVLDITGQTEFKVGKADIVLISDGSDGSIDDIPMVKKLLGNIDLHVIMIGMENPSLKAVAKTYIVLS